MKPHNLASKSSGVGHTNGCGNGKYPDSRKPFRFFGVLGIAISIYGCAGLNSSEPQSPPTKEGCSRPAVLSSISDTTVDIASLGIEQVTMGGFKYQKKPQIVDAFTAMSKDTLIIDYQVCLAIHKHGYTVAQAEWLRSQLVFFMRTNPTPDQADKWLVNHPFPVSGKNSQSGNTTYGQESPILDNINTGGGDFNYKK